jgi:hypothetical protein
MSVGVMEDWVSSLFRKKNKKGKMAKTVLAFLMEGVEEIEFVTPVDIWRRAGFDVTVASLGY